MSEETITAEKAKELLASFDDVGARDDEPVSVTAGEMRKLIRTIIAQDARIDALEYDLSCTCEMSDDDCTCAGCIAKNERADRENAEAGL